MTAAGCKGVLMELENHCTAERYWRARQQLPEQFCGVKTRSNPACNAEVHSLSAVTDTNGMLSMAALAQGNVSAVWTCQSCENSIHSLESRFGAA